MAFLTGIEIRKIISEKRILIDSLDPRYPFNFDLQVTEDSIDLRLAPLALKYKASVKKVDYLKDDLEDLFEMVEIPTSGYEIQPGHALFSQTLEAITLSDDLVGFVVTRSTFARLGVMANCIAPKFATGISWAFPLQIINCNSMPIIIYPYAIIAQLMISTMQGQPIGYSGQMQHCYTPIPPLVSDRERTALKNISSDATKRTFHILTKEIEIRKKELEDKVSESKIETIAKKDKLDNSTVITSRIIKGAMGILSAIGFGIVGNLLSEGSFDYWKTVSLVLLTILSLVLLAGSVLFSNAFLKAIKLSSHDND